MTQNHPNIIGIHDGHNASVALMVNGELVSCYQEERFTKEKNFDGFPEEALNNILSDNNLKLEDIDLVGLNGFYQPDPLSRLERLSAFKSRSDSYLNVKAFLKRMPGMKSAMRQINRENRIANLNKLCITGEKVNFLDHHYLHAAAAYFGSNFDGEEAIVLTNDGSGDGFSAKVFIAEGKKLVEISSVSDRASIGHLYSIFTFLLGMVPLEHEYKIMGMEPYCDRERALKFKDELMELFKFDSPESLTWSYRGGKNIFYDVPFLEKLIRHKRFDVVMGGLQIFTEEFLVEWVRRCILKTGLTKICMSGGTFMNVKANQKIMDLDQVERIFVFPSCGDESNAIGACYAVAQKHEIDFKPGIDTVYLGPDIVYPKNMEEYVEAKTGCRIRCEYVGADEINVVVAELMSRGEVVGRFNGREEFGARSLGNRAILADPTGKDVIKHINELIKNRDFWMPFACSVKAERFNDYVVSSEKNSPEYMIMTFNTVESKRNEMLGGIHPYDSSVRPQIVFREKNPSYHSLLEEFEKLTGRGVIMNTSLNLHGLPLANNLDDCLNILNHSGLNYLQYGEYLLTRN